MDEPLIETEMGFEWDPVKASANETKHGVSFLGATKIFLDPGRVVRKDDRKDYGEERFLVLGVTDGDCLAVVYTRRGNAYRLISARKANARERRNYRQVSTRSEESSENNGGGAEATRFDD